MIVGILREISPGESRVALVPDSASALVRDGHEIRIEAGAGESAGFADAAYQKAGAKVAPRDEIIKSAMLVSVQASAIDASKLRPDQTLIGFFDSPANPQSVKSLSQKGVTAFALELMPRIARAQPMDALTSTSTLLGYRAAIEAAHASPKLFPLMMTSTGTNAPARVFVIGAGIAGLQAIATARRLGADVQAYDVRPEAKEAIESLGAKFFDTGLETSSFKDKDGYAADLGDDFYTKQRDRMARTVAASDVVITSARVPGRAAPRLVTASMAAAMKAGSVIVDLAGNCESARAGETVVERGVTTISLAGVPPLLANQASVMFSENVLAFLRHVIKQGKPDEHSRDAIMRRTLLVRGGEVVNEAIRKLLGLAPIPAPKPIVEPTPEPPAEIKADVPAVVTASEPPAAPLTGKERQAAKKKKGAEPAPAPEPPKEPAVMAPPPEPSPAEEDPVVDLFASKLRLQPMQVAPRSAPPPAPKPKPKPVIKSAPPPKKSKGPNKPKK